MLDLLIWGYLGLLAVGILGCLAAPRPEPPPPEPFTPSPEWKDYFKDDK